VENELAEKIVSAKERLVLALDVDTKSEVRTLVRELIDLVGAFKVGPRLFTRYGPKIIEVIQKEGGSRRDGGRYVHPAYPGRI